MRPLTLPPPIVVSMDPGEDSSNILDCRLPGSPLRGARTGLDSVEVFMDHDCSRRCSSIPTAAAAVLPSSASVYSFYSCSQDVIEYPIYHCDPSFAEEFFPGATASSSGSSWSMSVWCKSVITFVLKVVFTIVPRPQPGIWTMENSMNTWSLRFRDDKIERGYQWNVNKRYLRANRRFSWFMLAFTLLFVVYHWLVETDNRFLVYLPCNIVMVLPMIVSTAFTYVKMHDRYFVYKYMHIVLTVCLFITSLGWMFGQPFVLIVLRDPLILDPVHTLLIFFIFNLAVTNLYLSVVSTTALITIQALTCIVGLWMTGRAFSHIFSYLVNDLLSLILAHIFAFMCSRVRELYMRQIYLVRHFQQEEAHILASSRLKLQILDEGMKALKNQHPHISPPSSPAIRRNGNWLSIGRSSIPLIRQSSTIQNSILFPPRALILSASSTPVLSHSSALNAPNAWEISDGTSTPLLRLMRSCQLDDNGYHSGMGTPTESKAPAELETDDCDTKANTAKNSEENSDASSVSETLSPPVPLSNEMFSTSEKSDHVNLFHILSDLPHWLWTLPHSIHHTRHRKLRQKSLWKRMYQFFKFKVCMYSGEGQMEEGFKMYYNPLSICRIKVLALSAIIGGITQTSLNFIIQTADPFDTAVRIAFMPGIALTAYILLSTDRIVKNPRLTQTVIAISVYFLFVGNLLLVFDSHALLRATYKRIDPLSKFPSLNTPSSSPMDESKMFPWIPQSPFENNFSIFNDILSPNVTNYNSNVDPYDFIDAYEAANSTMSADDFEHYKVTLLSDYIAAESKFMLQLNAISLFLCFIASSSGMRLVYYIAWAFLISITVLSSIIYWMIVVGQDGQLIRTSFVVVAVAIAGVWIVRPLESEIRKWYNIKVNYKL